jgi:DUF4097 and DUF4098 domain-containing protein YvlB
MRRGSLVGPLLIILIGVWFLMSTLRPELRLFDLAARFWPFLLIGWGVLRCAEILLWAAYGKPLPRAGVSSGEWALIVFICILGSCLFVVNHHPWEHWGFITGDQVEIFGHPYDFPVPEQTAPAPKAARILVENLRGNLHIVGADTQDVKVSGHKTIRALRDGDANDAQKQTPVEISTQGNQLVVRTNQDRVTGGQRVSTDLEIAVPRAASLEIHGRDGDLDISDINGTVDVSSDTASVRLQNIASNVRLDLHKSDLVRAGAIKGNFELQSVHGRDVELDTMGGEVTVNGSYSGDLQFRDCAKLLKFQSPQTDLRVEKLPGQIHMDLGSLNGSNLVGPVRLTSNRPRDVQIEQFTQTLELQLDHGDITLRPLTTPLAKIDAHTHSGQIELTLPESARFDLKATTTRGDLNNEYGAALKTEYQSERRHESGGSISGGVGQGPPITLATERGSITIRKDTGLPPKPPAPPAPPRAPGVSPIETEKH